MKKEEILNSPRLDIRNNQQVILSIYKASDEKFYVFDKWNSFVAVFGQDLMSDFFLGNESIMDSHAKLWFYNEISEDDKIPKEKLENFINVFC